MSKSPTIDSLTIHLIETTISGGAKLPDTVMGKTIEFLIANRKLQLALNVQLRAQNAYIEKVLVSRRLTAAKKDKEKCL